MDSNAPFSPQEGQPNGMRKIPMRMRLSCIVVRRGRMGILYGPAKAEGLRIGLDKYHKGVYIGADERMC